MRPRLSNPPVPFFIKPTLPPPPNHVYMRGMSIVNDFELSESKERSDDWRHTMDCPDEIRATAIKQYGEKWDGRELELSKGDPRVMTERGVYVLATIIGVVLFGIFLASLIGPW